MKKKDKKFETLEDIEQKLISSSGRKKEKKTTPKKTAYPMRFSLEDILREYGRLLVIPAVCLVLMVLIMIAEAVTGAKAGISESEAVSAASAETGGPLSENGGAAANEAAEPAEASESETAETEAPIDPNKLRVCDVPAIDSLINEYFAARLSADADTLYRLFGRTGDTGKEALTKKLEAQASWIQSYDGIEIYTLPGMDEDSRVCIIRYKINFRRTDTMAPGIMYCYVMRGSDGSFVIGENLPSDIVKHVNEKLEDADVIAMQDEVNAELKNALDSDSDLALIYTSFLNGEIYNETAPDLNSEQEVDLFLNPEDSDLAGGLVVEIHSDEPVGADASEASENGGTAGSDAGNGDASLDAAEPDTGGGASAPAEEAVTESAAETAAQSTETESALPESTAPSESEVNIVING